MYVIILSYSANHGWHFLVKPRDLSRVAGMERKSILKVLPRDC